MTDRCDFLASDQAVVVYGDKKKKFLSGLKQGI